MQVWINLSLNNFNNIQILNKFPSQKVVHKDT